MTTKTYSENESAALVQSLVGGLAAVLSKNPDITVDFTATPATRQAVETKSLATKIPVDDLNLEEFLKPLAWARICPTPPNGAIDMQTKSYLVDIWVKRWMRVAAAGVDPASTMPVYIQKLLALADMAHEEAAHAR